MKLPLVCGNNNRIGLQSGRLDVTSGLFSTLEEIFRQSIFASFFEFPHDLSPEWELARYVKRYRIMDAVGVLDVAAAGMRWTPLLWGTLKSYSIYNGVHIW